MSVMLHVSVSLQPRNNGMELKDYTAYNTVKLCLKHEQQRLTGFKTMRRS